MDELRITFWPPAQMSVPPVPVYRVRLRGEFLLLGPRLLITRLPGEAYLRGVRSVDSGNPASLNNLMVEFGPFVWPGPCALPVERYPRLDSTVEQIRSISPPFAVAPGWEFVHCREAALYVHVIRDMVSIWRCHSGQREWAELESQWCSTWVDPPEDAARAYAFLVDCLNVGLSALRVSASVQTGDGAGMPDPEALPGLFSSLCVQMANHIIEGARYKVCAHERCKSLFVRQGGSGKIRQRVKYCSLYCARAAASAAWRQRNP